MNPFVLPLDRAGAAGIELLGGKGAGLAALLAAGFPVPQGFCVTTRAFEASIGLAGVSGGDDLPGPVGTLAEPSGPLVLEIPLPARVRDEILAAYRVLRGERDCPVAVRSSATAEDLPEQSFAGQHDTFLNVSGEEEVLGCVRRCWASLWNERAVSYREHRGVDPRRLRMAVVVQRLVVCRAAGVIFTVNPSSGDPRELIVNSVWGLGEGVVSGRITPDELIVDRATLQVVRQRIANKAEMVVPAGHLTTSAAVNEALRTELCLDGVMLRELATLALRIEKLMGGFQDIEWGVSEEGLHIFQSRPVTGRTPPVVWGSRQSCELLRGRLVLWSNWNTRETMPYPFSPLAWTHFNQVVAPGTMEVLWGITPGSPLGPYSRGIVDLVYGRLYWNMTVLFAHPMLGWLMRKGLGHLDAEADRRFAELEGMGLLQTPRLPVGHWELTKAWGRAVGAVARYPWLAGPRRMARLADEGWQASLRLETMSLGHLDVSGLLDLARDHTGRMVALGFPMLMVASRALLASKGIAWLLRRHPDLDPARLATGLAGNKTTEMALELYRLAQVPEPVKQLFLELGDDDLWRALPGTPDGQACLERLRRFLDLYGHRGAREMDLLVPRWQEDPSFVLAMVRAYLRDDDGGPTPLDRFATQVAGRKALTVEVERRLGASRFARMVPWKRWLFHWLLDTVHTCLPLRENEKHYALRGYLGIRRVLLEIGRRIEASLHLQAPEDVFFLTWTELEGWEAMTGDARLALVQDIPERRRRWEALGAIEAPFIVRSDGLPVPAGVPPVAETGVLHGTAASPGRAAGRARVVREVGEGAKLIKGEVLVAPTTDPGWTPLFLNAAGLVMEVGGVLCHGAIVAREYGIPAVVGVSGATDRIRDGDEVVVDGSAGTVRLPSTPGAL